MNYFDSKAPRFEGGIKKLIQGHLASKLIEELSPQYPEKVEKELLRKINGMMSAKFLKVIFTEMQTF